VIARKEWGAIRLQHTHVLQAPVTGNLPTYAAPVVDVHAGYWLHASSV
jgi:hypothetical protein